MMRWVWRHWMALVLFLKLVWREWEPPRKDDPEWNKYRIRFRFSIRFAWTWAALIWLNSRTDVRGENDRF